MLHKKGLSFFFLPKKKYFCNDFIFYIMYSALPEYTFTMKLT